MGTFEKVMAVVGAIGFLSLLACFVLWPRNRATVWVTMYDHKHGTDIDVFYSEEAAEAYRQGLADDWWDEAMDEPKPADPKEAADAYFAAGAKHGEFFDVREQAVRQ